ncbi:MAG: hypothetical protein WA956_06555 [Stenotrophomonas sp.]
MKTLETQIQSLKRQTEASPWLKWAGLAITILLASFMVQGLEGWRVKQQKTAIDAEQNLKRILALKGQDAWLERETNARQLRDALWAQLPKVATTGMAQAALQSWLRNITSGFESRQNVTIRVNRSGPVEGMPGVIRVNAALNGALSPRQSLGLLRQIENSPNLIVVETLTLQSDDSNTLHLTVNAYYQVTEEGAP